MRKIHIGLALALIIGFININAYAAPPEIDIKAKSALLADARSGELLYAQNENEKVFPASLTKLLTALIVAENCSLDEKVVVSASALEGLSIYGSTAALSIGEELTVYQALLCLLVASANEAANVLAEHVAGSIPAFIEMMNARAAELGCKNTHVTNTHGLHDDEHYTTAYDIYLIAGEVRKHDELVEIYGMPKVVLPKTNMSEERIFFSTNSLISPYRERTYLYSRAKGIKTGTTTAAGLCLVSEAAKSGVFLISVVMGAEVDKDTGKKQNFTETVRLFEWGFANFKPVALLKQLQPICEVAVRLAKQRDYVVAVTENELDTLIPVDFDEAKLETITDVAESVDAPINKGDVLGTVVLKYGDREFPPVNLIATDSVGR